MKTRLLDSWTDITYCNIVRDIWPNTSSESLLVAIGKLEMHINTSPILNLLLPFRKFVLLKLMVQSQASKVQYS